MSHFASLSDNIAHMYAVRKWNGHLKTFGGWSKMETIAPMLCAEEVSELLQLPVSSVWTKVRNGALPHVRIGRLIRFPRAPIMAIAAGQSVPAAAKDA